MLMFYFRKKCLLDSACSLTTTLSGIGRSTNPPKWIDSKIKNGIKPNNPHKVLAFTATKSKPWGSKAVHQMVNVSIPSFDLFGFNDLSYYWNISVTRSLWTLLFLKVSFGRTKCFQILQVCFFCGVQWQKGLPKWCWCLKS